MFSLAVDSPLNMHFNWAPFENSYLYVDGVSGAKIQTIKCKNLHINKLIA